MKHSSEPLDTVTTYNPLPKVHPSSPVIPVQSDVQADQTTFKADMVAMQPFPESPDTVNTYNPLPEVHSSSPVIPVQSDDQADQTTSQGRKAKWTAVETEVFEKFFSRNIRSKTMPHGAIIKHC